MILTVPVVLQFVFKILYSSIVVYLLFWLSPVIPFTVDPYVLQIKILSFFHQIRNYSLFLLQKPL